MMTWSGYLEWDYNVTILAVYLYYKKPTMTLYEHYNNTTVALYDRDSDSTSRYKNIIMIEMIL